MMWGLIIISLISLAVAHILFLGGRNLIIALLILETLFLSGSLLFITFYYDPSNPLINHDALFFAFATIIWSAGETAVLLALISRIFRKARTIYIVGGNNEF